MKVFANTAFIKFYLEFNFRAITSILILTASSLAMGSSLQGLDLEENLKLGARDLLTYENNEVPDLAQKIDETVTKAIGFKQKYEQLLGAYKLTGYSENKIKTGVYRFEFDSPIQRPGSLSNKIYGYLYEPKFSRGCKYNVPATLFIHHVADDISDEQVLAERANSDGRGGWTMLIYLPEYGPRRTDKQAPQFAKDINIFTEQILQSLVEIRIAGQILKNRVGAKTYPLQLGGLSLGAMLVAISAGIDPFFDQYLIAMGGGDLAKTMTTEKKLLKGRVRDALKDVEWTREEAKSSFAGLDAMTWAHNIKSKSIIILGSKDDELISYPAVTKMIAAYQQGGNSVLYKAHSGTHVPDHKQMGIGKALMTYLSIINSLVEFVGPNKSDQISMCVGG